MAIISDYDTAWKEAIDIYFEDFMEFFFPQAHNQIDWERGYENLETELQEIIRDAETGRRFADKLKKVWLENGQETWLLIHIEIQSQVKTNFAKRMYVYNHRLFDRYDREVISFAILGDDSPTWRPKSYTYSRWRFKTRIKFPTVKLLDYQSNWEALEKSHNPFAVVVMGHLSAMTTSDRPLDRFDSKLKIVRLLFERGYTKREIYDLLRFLDWLMALPPELEQNFKTEKKQIEEEKTMPMITSWERDGMADATRNDVLEVLEIRFASEASQLRDGFVQLHRQLEPMQELIVLKQLHKKAISVTSIEEFEELLSGDPANLIPDEPVEIAPVRPSWLDRPIDPNSPWYQIEPSPQRTSPALEQPLEQAISQIGVMVGEELRARENARSSLVAVLEVRFGEVSGETSDRIYTFTNLDILKELLKKAVVVANLQEFDRVLSETEET